MNGVAAAAAVVVVPAAGGGGDPANCTGYDTIKDMVEWWAYKLIMEDSYNVDHYAQLEMLMPEGKTIKARPEDSIAKRWQILKYWETFAKADLKNKDRYEYLYEKLQSMGAISFRGIMDEDKKLDDSFKNVMTLMRVQTVLAAIHTETFTDEDGTKADDLDVENYRDELEYAYQEWQPRGAEVPEELQSVMRSGYRYDVVRENIVKLTDSRNEGSLNYKYSHSYLRKEVLGLLQAWMYRLPTPTLVQVGYRGVRSDSFDKHQMQQPRQQQRRQQRGIQNPRRSNEQQRRQLQARREQQGANDMNPAVPTDEDDSETAEEVPPRAIGLSSSPRKPANNMDVFAKAADARATQSASFPLQRRDSNNARPSQKAAAMAAATSPSAKSHTELSFDDGFDGGNYFAKRRPIRRCRRSSTPELPRARGRQLQKLIDVDDYDSSSSSTCLGDGKDYGHHGSRRRPDTRTHHRSEGRSSYRYDRRRLDVARSVVDDHRRRRRHLHDYPRDEDDVPPRRRTDGLVGKNKKRKASYDYPKEDFEDEPRRHGDKRRRYGRTHSLSSEDDPFNNRKPRARNEKLKNLDDTKPLSRGVDDFTEKEITSKFVVGNAR